MDEKSKNYRGLIQDICDNLGFCRLTVMKYLDTDKSSIRGKKINECAQMLREKHWRENNGIMSADNNELEEKKDGKVRLKPKIERIGDIRKTLPFFYLKGASALGAYTGYKDSRVHREWRDKGMPFYVDENGTFIYKSDEVDSFIKANYTPQKINPDIKISAPVR